jgi:hypothetical protein
VRERLALLLPVLLLPWTHQRQNPDQHHEHPA